MKKNNAYLELIGASFQMAITIYGGVYLGKWLDTKYSFDKNWFTILFTLLSVGISIYFVVATLNRINKNE